MKHFLFLILLFNFGSNCLGQSFYLKTIGNNTSETKSIDSLNYNSKHINTKSIVDEINLISEKLSKIGYIENKIIENTKTNDSSYVAKISLGKKTKNIHIYIGNHFSSIAEKHPEIDYTTLKNSIGLDLTKDSLKLAYSETENFMSQTLQKLEQNGFAMAKIKLINIQKKNNELYADFYFDLGQVRKLNDIEITFATTKKNSFPEGHLKQIKRKYVNHSFNQNLVKKIYDDFDKFRFVSQVKQPEILFTKDTTKVYVYLEKRKSNTFDGYIGFSNNDTKLVLNGYLDLILENALKAGEQFAVLWKSDGNNQKNFKASIDLPYLFKSPIGLKAQLNIFKQDSIFQNTKTAIDLGYIINYNTRIYLGYQSTESSDIQNTNNNSISDYQNAFVTTNLEFSELDYTHSFFYKKTNLSITVGSGNRTTNGLVETLGTNKQTYYNINAMRNFYLNKKNGINLNFQNYFLKSDSYIINELYRFGGVSSLRGFAENSLQANFMATIATEYRYIASPELFFNTIMDYGYYEDKSINSKEKLIGFGLGMGLLTKNGILKISFANGSTTTQTIQFSNTIATINYNIKF